MEAFWCFCLKAKNGVDVFFYVEKRMESKEVIKRKFENLEKALEKVIFKKLEDWFVVFNIGKYLGSLSYYSTIYSSLKILSVSTWS